MPNNRYRSPDCDGTDLISENTKMSLKQPKYNIT